MSHLLKAAIVAAGLVCMAGTSQATVLWSQPAITGDPLAALADTYNSRVYDDFSVSASWTVSGGSFWVYEPAGADASQYDLEIAFFRHDAGGTAPGTYVTHQVVPTADVTRTSDNAANYIYDPDYYDTDGWRYDFTLAPGIDLASGDYWMSIRILEPVWSRLAFMVGHEPCDLDCALSSTGAFVGDLVGDEFHQATNWEGRTFDLAFELTGVATALPEPGTLALLGLGGLAAASRRRKAA